MCPVTCGEATSLRTFQVVQNATNGGPPCEFDNGEVFGRHCQVAPCQISTAIPATSNDGSADASDDVVADAFRFANDTDTVVAIQLPDETCVASTQPSTQSPVTPCPITTYNVSLVELFRRLGISGVDSIAIYPSSIMVDSTGSIHVRMAEAVSHAVMPRSKLTFFALSTFACRFHFYSQTKTET